MAVLEVQITDAPGPQRVDASAANQADWMQPTGLFPAFRVTNPEGWVNYVITDGPLANPMSVVFACQGAVSEIVNFDGTADVRVELPYAPFKQAVPDVPVLVRPPLPAPFPDPVRDGAVFATTLPWDSGATRQVQQTRFPFRFHPVPTTMAAPAPVHRDYLRGDAWGVRMANAPLIDGVNAATKDLILSWFLDRYPLEFQHAYLAKYAGYGYTHFYLSPPDSIQGAGKTLAQFVDTCELVKSYGLLVGLNLASKVYQPANMAPEPFIAYLDPLLDALLEVGDEFVPAWEWNLWNRTAPDAITIMRHVGQRAHGAGKTSWLHFGPHTTSWFKDGDPRGRFGFWDDLAGDVNGINYQSDPYWTTRELQDRMVDTLWQFGESKYDYKMRMWEDQATKQFNGHADENDGDARGYLSCCTYDNVKHTDALVWGFGNGGRRPDGTRI